MRAFPIIKTINTAAGNSPIFFNINSIYYFESVDDNITTLYMGEDEAGVQNIIEIGIGVNDLMTIINNSGILPKYFPIITDGFIFINTNKIQHFAPSNENPETASVIDLHFYIVDFGMKADDLQKVVNGYN